MKTTFELPDPLFRRAKVVAAQRGTTMKELVIAGLRHMTGEASSAMAGGTSKLTAEEAAVAAVGAHGLPVLKRPAHGRKVKITRALVDRIRDDLSL